MKEPWVPLVQTTVYKNHLINKLVVWDWAFPSNHPFHPNRNPNRTPNHQVTMILNVLDVAPPQYLWTKTPLKIFPWNPKSWRFGRCLFPCPRGDFLRFHVWDFWGECRHGNSHADWSFPPGAHQRPGFPTRGAGIPGDVGYRAPHCTIFQHLEDAGRFFCVCVSVFLPESWCTSTDGSMVGWQPGNVRTGGVLSHEISGRWFSPEATWVPWKSQDTNMQHQVK